MDRLKALIIEALIDLQYFQKMNNLVKENT